MKKISRMASRIIAGLLVFVMLGGMFPTTVFAAEDNNVNLSGNEEYGTSENTVYLAFTSDVHNKVTDASDTSSSAYRLNNWINGVTTTLGSEFENMAFCGDNADASSDSSEYWTRVQVVMDIVKNNTNVKGNGIFTSGNHEWDSGQYETYKSSNAAAQAIKVTGKAEETNDYVIYAFGATSGDQSGTGFQQADIDELGNYLNTAPTNKPIFVISHFPLHAYGNRTSYNAASVIETLNQYADDHDIYFLWGHNHTLSDTNYDTIITDKIEDTEIDFTYCAAGCMSDSEYNKGSNSVNGKGLVATIKDGEVSLEYYEEQTDISTPDPDTPEEPEAPVIDGNPFLDVKTTDYFYDAVLWAINKNVTTGTSATTFSPERTCTRAEAVTFLYRVFGKPAVTATENPFTDVVDTEDNWYYDAVLWAVEKGITHGTSATTFSPERTCTRAEILTMIWRACGKPEATSDEKPFADLVDTEDNWYYDAVLWAAEQGSTNGTSATTFSPKRTCTRAEMVTMLYRVYAEEE